MLPKATKIYFICRISDAGLDKFWFYTISYGLTSTGGETTVFLQATKIPFMTASLNLENLANAIYGFRRTGNF